MSSLLTIANNQNFDSIDPPLAPCRSPPPPPSPAIVDLNQHRQSIISSFNHHNSSFGTNPVRQFLLLKLTFALICIIDTVYWANMTRDGDDNMWHFYTDNQQSSDIIYLLVHIFSDIVLCLVGISAAMWMRKFLFAIPCCIMQLALIVYRTIVWIYRGALQRQSATLEHYVYIAAEFILPFVWFLLAFATIRIINQMRIYKQFNGYAQPPAIVLHVKNNEEDESVQIEIT